MMTRGALHLWAFDAAIDDAETLAMALMPQHFTGHPSSFPSETVRRQATNAGIYDYVIGHEIGSI